MTIKIITNWSVLMDKARAVAKAKASGDEKAIKMAEEDHESYRQLCLDADEMVIPQIPRR